MAQNFKIDQSTLLENQQHDEPNSAGKQHTTSNIFDKTQNGMAMNNALNDDENGQQ